MTVEAGQILDEYLAALEGELRDLPPADRAEIVLEVKAHFDEARRELTDPSEAELRNIVERLGPPAEIAAEARDRAGVEARPSPAAVRRGWAWTGGWAAAARIALVLLGAWLVWLLVGGPLVLFALKARSG